jgi:hypothetical protein
MKRNDTGPPIKGKLVNNGAAVDLTGVTVTFNMYKVNDDGTTTQIVSSAATVETPVANGKFYYDWQVGDTTDVGNHLASFELIFTADNNRKETYPNDGWIEVRITPDLENS